MQKITKNYINKFMNLLKQEPDIYKQDISIIQAALYIMFKKREAFVYELWNDPTHEGACYYEGLEDVADFALFAFRRINGYCDISVYDIYNELLTEIKSWEDWLWEEENKLEEIGNE